MGAASLALWPPCPGSEISSRRAQCISARHPPTPHRPPCSLFELGEGSGDGFPAIPASILGLEVVWPCGEVHRPEAGGSGSVGTSLCNPSLEEDAGHS